MSVYSIGWIIFTIALLVLELATVNLICIWFIIGAFFATIISIFIQNLAIQVIIFLIASTISIFLTKPLSDKILKNNKTNIDSIIGKSCLVTQDINNIENVGEVFINGLPWKAKSIDNKEINKDTLVDIIKIEGVSLIVKEHIEESYINTENK